MQRHFNRAIVALFVSGATDLALADLRVNRALSLLESRQVSEAIAELEAAAHAYEEAMAQPRMRRSGKGLEYAERLVQILLLLLPAYLQAEDEQQVRAAEKRLLALHDGAPERHESDARLLLHAAECFHKRQDTEQAFPQLVQADRLYGQQLASLLGPEGKNLDMSVNLFIGLGSLPHLFNEPGKLIHSPITYFCKDLRVTSGSVSAQTAAFCNIWPSFFPDLSRGLVQCLIMYCPHGQKGAPGLDRSTFGRYTLCNRCRNRLRHRLQ